MARLIACPSCKASVSNKATACPQCGHPLRRQTSPAAAGCAVMLVLFFLVIFIGHLAGTDDDSKASTPPEKPELSDAQCRQDLQCWGERNWIKAAYPCKHAVEAKALHEVKWTDGMLDPMFSRYGWSDKKAGVLNLVGDKVEFQNGFGAMTPMTYICTYDPNTDTVTTAQVGEGRLPE